MSRKIADPTQVKKFNKQAPKLPALGLWKYLHTWDVSSSAKRDSMILTFIEHYTTLDPVDLDTCLSHGGSLIFARFVVAMQLAYERKKPIWHYCQVLGLFMKSLQCEQYVYEFCQMGGFSTAFSCLKLDEMKIRDKANVLYFLYHTIDGPSGTRVKNFICQESTFLDAVVDSLTMCNNASVIHFGQLFLENMCISTKMDNLTTVANYVISLLPCDFNPKVQIMACEILLLAIHQKDSIAAKCYEYIVDVLKTDYDPVLVPVGELCISIMSTPSADELLTKLIDVVEPLNLNEDSVDADWTGPSFGGGGGGAAVVAGRSEERERGRDMDEPKLSRRRATAEVEAETPIPDMLEMVHQEPHDELDKYQEKESEMSLLESMQAAAATTVSTLSTDISFLERPAAKSVVDPDVVHVGRTGGRLAAALNADMFYRQQLGSIFVLIFMLKNRTDFADWMIQKGIIGNLLTAIGSSSHHRVQLSAVRLLLLIHDLTPDCVAALRFLLPDKVVAIILEKGERCLEYITAVQCYILRRLGRLVKRYWQQWFDNVVLPSTSKASGVETANLSTSISASTETFSSARGQSTATPEPEVTATTDPEKPGQEESKTQTQSQQDNRKSRFSSVKPMVERPIESVLQEIKTYTEQLEALIGPSFDHIVSTMDLICPDEEFFGESLERKSGLRLVNKRAEELTPGEIDILTNENLEKFRKYLTRAEKEREDEFEKYYASKFGHESETTDMTGMDQAALLEAERAIFRLKNGGADTDEATQGPTEAQTAAPSAVSSDLPLSVAAARSYSSNLDELDALNLGGSKDTVKA